MPIKVSTLHRTGRRFIECQWVDPVSGLKKTKSTGTANRREAERFASRLEEQLNNDGAIEPAQVTWDALFGRYKADVMAGQAAKTASKTGTAANALVRLLNPKMANALTTEVLVRFASRLRDEGLASYTIKGYLAEIRKVLRWGDRLGLLHRAPRIEMPRTTGGMKGRPITLEEFERMLGKVAAVCGVQGEATWQRMLQGLWLSGLRLEEAMRLHWTSETDISVDLTGRYPMLRIQSHAQKSRQFELLPLSPEFAKFLLATPAHEQRGFVFDPQPLRPPLHVRPSAEWVGKIVSRIGKAAGVRVNDGKFASAHDFRRAFGTRWSLKVMPAVLQALMRHKSIQTTMQFYVGKNAESIAEQAWKTEPGNTFGNSDRPAGHESQSLREKTPEIQGF